MKKNAFLSLVMGACLLVSAYAPAYAQESTIDVQTTTTEKQPSKWLDEYPKHVGFSWNVGADINANYIWRGLYVGGLGIQPDFMVGYGGLYLDMWWNISANDWTFTSFPANARVKGLNPEVDMTIGFSRWGLDIKFMHMYYFDRYKNFDGSIGGNSRYFDFSNAAPGGGITQEWRIKYKVSSKLPLSIMWCTRTWGRDGYMVNGEGEQINPAIFNTLGEEEQDQCHTHRAYSSYLEIGYDFSLPWNLTLAARVGMTPWKSMYTGYQADFAVVNLDAKLSRAFDLGEHLYMTAFADLMLNPYDIAAQATGVEGFGAINGGRQFLWNLGCGFYLK